MSMAVPKVNSDATSLFFGGASLIGALCAAYAYTGGRFASLVPMPG